MGPICRLGWHEGRAEGWSGSSTFLIDLAGLYGPSDTSRPSIVSVQSDRGASCNSKSSEGEEWRNKPPHSFSLEAAITHTQTHAYTLYWHIQTLEINMQTGMFVVCLGCTEALQQCGKKSHAGYAVSAALSRPEGWQTIWLVEPLWAGKFDRGNGAGGWKEIFHGICRKRAWMSIENELKVAAKCVFEAFSFSLKWLLKLQKKIRTIRREKRLSFKFEK